MTIEMPPFDPMIVLVSIFEWLAWAIVACFVIGAITAVILDVTRR